MDACVIVLILIFRLPFDTVLSWVLLCILYGMISLQPVCNIGKVMNFQLEVNWDEWEGGEEEGKF